MASKNIVAKGTTYNGVESVTFPVSGGGDATFYEISDTTAGASDVLNSKYFYTSSGVKTQGTGTGGTANIQSLSVTQNGTYTASGGVDGYSPVTVSVSGGGGLEYESGTYTTAEGVTSTDISFSGTHTNVPFFVGFVDITNDYDDTLNTGYAWWYFDWHELYGTEVYASTTTKQYGYKVYRYRSSSATSLSGSTTAITSYPDSNLTNTGFHVGFAGAYLRPNRTYKWIAVWKPTT